ncbi:hypothetical protein [Pseudofrankia asymbiotica]|uniref:hypothetical protein n=1 Tax=Pseudofrankia asymbiotica TaxID=1834516 RepID=UPI0010563A44|nr:hypothetical protein [Pseudofrankia asymbiotica]
MALSATVPGQAATTIELHTHPSLASTATVAGCCEVSLVRLGPDKTAEGPDPGDYRASLRVRRP